MLHLEIGGERYAIAAGETAIGSAADNTVVLAGEGVQPRHAVVQATKPGSADIRVAGADAEVKVNGVRLGAEPTPLLHGDKIAIGSHELRVVDSARGGSTQLFDSGAASVTVTIGLWLVVIAGIITVVAGIMMAMARSGQPMITRDPIRSRAG